MYGITLPVMIRKVPPVYALLKIRKRLCKKTFKGKFTTNLKAHLRLEHVDKFKEFQTEEKHKKENSSRRKVQAKRSSNLSSEQKTLTECSHKAIPYDPQSSKQKCLTRKLALFIAKSNVLLNLAGGKC